jgi:hypothetical protein
MTKRLPTEFAINMFLEKFLILQQSELASVNQMNYFDEYNPCHLYFICKRPRLSINPDKFIVNKDKILIYVFEHKKDEKIEHELEFKNNLRTLDVELKTEYPFNTFKIYREKELYSEGKVSPLLQSNPFISKDFLDLEILYVGQSYGVDGARTAPDRLVNHSTLQGIYSEAIINNPDSEIWLCLASFSQINMMVMNGKGKFTQEELELDETRMKHVSNIINFEGINEQQKINFTEASLIRYFQPKYNKIYKDTFPNPAHKTYSECYDLDINSVGIEMHTKEIINCRMYSDDVERKDYHLHSFLLHSPEERKSIFDIF